MDTVYVCSVLQKSDGDLVSLTSYDQEKRSLVSVSGYFGSSVSSPEESLKYLTASTRVESALASMVPCKQTSPAATDTFIPYKESDTNGNDIRSDTATRPVGSYFSMFYLFRSDKNLPSPDRSPEKADVS